MRIMLIILLLVGLLAGTIPASADGGVEVFCYFAANPRPDLDTRNFQWRAVTQGFEFGRGLTRTLDNAWSACGNAANNLRPPGGVPVTVWFQTDGGWVG